MKITAKLREEAAILCSVAASYEVLELQFSGGYAFKAPRTYGLMMMAFHFDAPSEAALLGEYAALHLTGEISATNRLTWAEAEALLRTGFVPEGWES